MNGGNEKEENYLPESKPSVGKEKIVLEVKGEEKQKVGKKKGCC